MTAGVASVGNEAIQVEAFAADFGESVAELGGGELAQQAPGEKRAKPGMAGAEVRGGDETALAGEGRDERARSGGLSEVSLGMGKSGAAHFFTAGGVLEQGGKVTRKGLRITLCAQQAGLVFHDHFRNACEPGGDAGQAGGHGFHQHRGKIVFATITLRGAGEGKDLRFLCQQADDLRHAEGAGKMDAAFEFEFCDLAAERVFERAFTDDAALERNALITQDSACADQVWVAFFFDQATNAQKTTRSARAVSSGACVNQRLEVETIVNTLDARSVSGELSAELGGREVADSDDQ